MKHGFLLIDKPAGPTSHDIVARVRAQLKERKVGHLGTLDPAASGLLVLAVGAKALKVVELFSALSKEYVAGVRLGSVSSTYDGEGVVEELEPKPGWTMPSEVELRSIIDDHFVGSISQVPPAHSAVHVGGERAYRKARQGRAVDMPERQVRIAKCAVQHYAYPDLSLQVSCSSGTYLRSLAHDLGQKLRCGGYLSDLRRTRVGEWSVDFAVPPDSVGWSHVFPLYEVMEQFTRVDLNETEAEDVRHGRNIDREVAADTVAWFEEYPIAILVPAKDGSRMAHARKVF